MQNGANFQQMHLQHFSVLLNKHPRLRFATELPAPIQTNRVPSLQRVNFLGLTLHYSCLRRPYANISSTAAASSRDNEM